MLSVGKVDHLVEALEQVARLGSLHGALGVYAYDSRGRMSFVSYADLHARALRHATFFARLGHAPGTPVVMVLQNSPLFFPAFFGALMVGLVPAPLAAPLVFSSPAQFVRKLQHIVDRIGRPCPIVSDFDLSHYHAQLDDRARRDHPRFDVRAMAAELDALPPVDRIRPHDLALLQFTSGSTSEPKGVMLGHDNVLANIEAVIEGINLAPDDFTVTWLPLYHDMGLIGGALTPIARGTPFALLSPFDFIRQPARWLWAMHHHRATMSVAPNFAYAYATRKVTTKQQRGLNLRSWRVALCGAERIQTQTPVSFVRKFAVNGFRVEAFFPVYGLAESVLAVTFPSPGARFEDAVLDRKALYEERRVELLPAARGDEDADERGLSVVAVGRAVLGHEVRVCEVDGGAPVGERVLGEVQVRGASVMRGYWGSPDATRAAFAGEGGDWLKTGDLGFVHRGALYVVDRLKDLVIKNGQNFYATDVEKVIAGLPWARPGEIVCFAFADAGGAERAVAAVGVRPPLRDGFDPEQARREVRERVAETTGLVLDDVALVEPRTLPKTTSGKLQRHRSRELYLSGGLAFVAAGA